MKYTIQTYKKHIHVRQYSVAVSDLEEKHIKLQIE
jgi:hypothetical protein